MQSQQVVKSGSCHVKSRGTLISRWKTRWLVLTSTAILVYKERNASNISLILPLSELTKVEHLQSVKSRRCLVLETEKHQSFLSFATESDLCSWHDAIYSRTSLFSPLLPPDSNDVHALISEYITPDNASSLSDVPIGWPPSNTLYVAPLPPPPEKPSIAIDSPMKAAHSPDENMNSEQRGLLRDAVKALCNVMEPRLLRKSEPGGEKPFDLVEVRLRALSRLQRKWTAGSKDTLLESEERKAFSEALKDGYILCQLMNTVHSSPILRPEVRDSDGTQNISNFLQACTRLGLPNDALFLPNDIADATPQSLTRVAQTIITLVNFKENSDPDSSSPIEKSTPEVPTSVKNVSYVDQWLDDLITTRREKMALLPLRAEGNMYRSPSFTTLPGRSYEDIKSVKATTYEFVTSFLLSEATATNRSFCGPLQRMIEFMRTLDPLSSLIDNRQYRLKLLQISGDLGVSDDRRLREALRKDDIELANLLRIIVTSETDKKAVMCLRGDDAQTFIDLMQNILDKASIVSSDDEGFVLKCRRLLVKVSEAQDILPSSLFIAGVDQRQNEATFGGSFGDIFRASYRGRDVALKRIRVFQRDSGIHMMRQHFCREALLWQRLRHPFVLPFIGIDRESFPSFLCMVSPWCIHGTILKHLSETGYANVERRLFEIAQGLAYLHSENVVHGDLRGSNILVNDDWNAVLADFGLAVFSDATAATRTSHQGGSMRWMAPELNDPQSFGLETFRRTFASDVYSFACVCLELYTGRPPFSNLPHDPTAMLRVLAGERPSRPSEVDRGAIPDHVWDIVELCWKQNYSERPNMLQVVEMMEKGNEDLKRLPLNKTLARIPLNRPPSAAYPKGLRVLHRQDTLSI